MKKLLQLIAVILFVALVALPVYGQNGRGRGLETAIAAQERHTDDLLAVEGVVGTAVGHGAEGRGAIFVFTTEPGIVEIPNELDGVPVIAHVTGEILALKPPPGKGPGTGKKIDPTARFDRPVPIGVSSGNVKLFDSDDGKTYCSVGTFGMRLVDDKGIFYALSNNHVYAHSNAATIGDAIVQPGTVDFDPVCGDNSDWDSIGTLFDFEDIIFCNLSSCPVNSIDAAIALTTTDLVDNSTPSDGYGTPDSTTVEAVINAKLEKYGRTTGPTKAIVWAINSPWTSSTTSMRMITQQKLHGLSARSLPKDRASAGVGIRVRW